MLEGEQFDSIREGSVEIDFVIETESCHQNIWRAGQ